MRMKIGIAGFGTLTKNRIAPPLAELDIFEVAAVYDPSENARRVAADRFPAAASCASMDEFLCQDLDGVYISTPNNSHASIAIACLEHGWGVLVEKPMASSVEDAEAMRHAAHKSGRPAMLAYMSKLNVYNTKAIEIVRGGGIGRILSMSSSFCFKMDDSAWQAPKASVKNAGTPSKDAWRLDREISGHGVLSDIGVYPVTTAADIFGEEPCACSASGYPAGDPSKALEAMLCTVRFGSGRAIDFEVSFHKDACMYSVIGSDGAIHVEGTWLQSGGGALVRVGKDGRQVIDKLPEANPYRAELEAFHSALQGNAVPNEMSFDRGCSDMRMLDALTRSADAKGQEIPVMPTNH